MYRHYIEQLERFNEVQKPAFPQQLHCQQTDKMSDLPELWDKLSKNESKSLLKKHLTEERYNALKDKKTKLGGTLADCIRSGKYYVCFVLFYYRN